MQNFASKIPHISNTNNYLIMLKNGHSIPIITHSEGDEYSNIFNKLNDDCNYAQFLQNVVLGLDDNPTQCSVVVSKSEIIAIIPNV